MTTFDDDVAAGLQGDADYDEAERRHAAGMGPKPMTNNRAPLRRAKNSWPAKPGEANVSLHDDEPMTNNHAEGEHTTSVCGARSATRPAGFARCCHLPAGHDDLLHADIHGQFAGATNNRAEGEEVRLQLKQERQYLADVMTNEGRLAAQVARLRATLNSLWNGDSAHDAMIRHALNDTAASPTEGLSGTEGLAEQFGLTAPHEHSPFAVKFASNGDWICPCGARGSHGWQGFATMHLWGIARERFDAALAQSSTDTTPDYGDLRPWREALTAPTCRGEDVCEVHGELLFDGECEDADRTRLHRLRSLLQPQDTEGGE